MGVFTQVASSIKGFAANFYANLLSHPVWMGPYVHVSWAWHTDKRPCCNSSLQFRYGGHWGPVQGECDNTHKQEVELSAGIDGVRTNKRGVVYWIAFDTYTTGRPARFSPHFHSWNRHSPCWPKTHILYQQYFCTWNPLVFQRWMCLSFASVSCKKYKQFLPVESA